VAELEQHSLPVAALLAAGEVQVVETKVSCRAWANSPLTTVRGSETLLEFVVFVLVVLVFGAVEGVTLFRLLEFAFFIEVGVGSGDVFGLV